jgi:hypothetical protein
VAANDDVFKSPSEQHLPWVLRSDATQEPPQLIWAVFATNDPGSLRDVIDVKKRLRLVTEELAGREEGEGGTEVLERLVDK